jgi:hypothetical protein
VTIWSFAGWFMQNQAPSKKKSPKNLVKLFSFLAIFLGGEQFPLLNEKIKFCQQE